MSPPPSSRPLRTLGFALLALAACDDPGRRRSADAPLDEMVESLLPAVERLAGIRAISPIVVERTTPTDVARYVETRLDHYLPGQQLEGMRRAYAMFGLLPDTLDLRSLLLELYGEQVAGFYDPDSQVLYIVDTEAAGPIEAVVVHELVHAIQDQHVNLDSLITQAGRNDRQMAAQAAIEGHATLAMYGWLAESMTGDTVNPAALPDPGAGVADLFSGNDRFPVFRRAPRIIRETLLFPYARGASFVQALWRASDSRIPPFGETLPHSTEQVLDPRTRFIDGRDEPTEIRHGEVEGWVAAYENTLGAFESHILLEERAGGGGANGWDGDRYTLYESADRTLLVWTSVWDSDPQADLFAERVASAYARDGEPGDSRVRRFDVDGRPAVRVTIGTAPDGGPDPEAYCVQADETRVTC